MRKVYLFILLLLLPQLTFANPQNQKHILVLHSYHASMNWVRHIDQAIDDVLQPSRNGYIIHREYMDTKRQFSPEYLNLLKQTYQLKYKNIHLSAILASDNNAFDFYALIEIRFLGKTRLSFFVA